MSTMSLVLLGLAVVDQDGLVELERVVPLLAPVQQRRPIQQRRQVGRVEVVGLLVVAQRLVAVAQLVGRLGQPVVQQRQLARWACARPCGTSISRIGQQRRPLLALEVQLATAARPPRRARDPAADVRANSSAACVLVAQLVAGRSCPASYSRRVFSSGLLVCCLGPHHQLRGLQPVAAPLVQAQQRQHRRARGRDPATAPRSRRSSAISGDAHLLVEDLAQAVVEVDLLLVGPPAAAAAAWHPRPSPTGRSPRTGAPGPRSASAWSGSNDSTSL